VSQAPEPVRDLDWAPERARAFADGAADLWEELLRRLPELPVRRRVCSDCRLLDPGRRP